jgi:hypothetical protein
MRFPPNVSIRVAFASEYGSCINQSGVPVTEALVSGPDSSN